ncbi:MAG: hypothetical protein JWR21_1046 [Herminiimonas sp.]|nr:hypothetical protein [Herminiimonas sp.]MDB5853731.1 hypothetical protein [Herminiimonas sp.]
MKALSIKDLSITEELDAKGMTAVRGGFCGFTMPSCYALPVACRAPSPASTVTTNVVVSQANNQLQSNATGNGSAVFCGSIPAYNDQQGYNHVG